MTEQEIKDLQEIDLRKIMNMQRKCKYCKKRDDCMYLKRTKLKNINGCPDFQPITIFRKRGLLFTKDKNGRMIRL